MQDAETVLGVIRERGRRSLPASPEVITGEPCAVNAARTVREGRRWVTAS